VITSEALHRTIVEPDGRTEPTIDDAIAAFIPPSDDWTKLQTACVRFLDNEWLDVAIAAGWSTIEIWGCYPSARLDVVKRRGDCLGLAPALALGMGCAFAHISKHEAVMTPARTGARLVHRRDLPGRDNAVLWWHAPFGGAQ
jgi:hypothetical protein